MQPSLNSSELKGLSDIWQNITNPSETETETESEPQPETPEASTDTEVEQPEGEDNTIEDKLQSSGHFSADEIERIVQADKWK